VAEVPKKPADAATPPAPVKPADAKPEAKPEAAKAPAPAGAKPAPAAGESKPAPAATAAPAAAAGPTAPPKPAVVPAPPRPKTVTEDVQALLDKFAGAFTHLEDTDPKIPTLQLNDRALLVAVMEHLQKERRFEHLALITTIDWKTHLEVVYNLWSYAKNVPLEVKVRLDPKDAKLASLTGLWATADWHERENFDLMGVVFEGHPNLKRILLPDEWKGHPLRKDYEWKKEQYVALDPLTGEDHVYAEPREGAW
jgi:NADH-quinone oxidoreductase subunit C